MYTRTAAEKYMVPELQRFCSEYILSHVNARNVCQLIEYVAHSDGGQVDDVVVSVLQQEGVAVVSSEGFMDASEITVEYVLRNVRNVPESCVVHGLHEWARSKVIKSLTMDRRDDDTTPIEDVKAAMAPFMPLLRFLALTPEEFIVGPSSWKIFEEREDFAILCNIVCHGSVPLPEWASSVRCQR
ncbi:hypothetical protein V5799_014425 [Amblyomma americanum]|uniref:Uncharacterized protein n=1 Tax=Amblyomma americanum TaxID=6943 RepID=A0AAQ4E351_AMBAM